MSETKIEWADYTFNPWVGCSKVSPACKNCYAEGWAKRSGLVKWGDQAERRRTSEANWRQPLKWNKQAKKAGERRRVFCASLADVFEDHSTIMPGWRADLGRLILDTPNLDWLLLTKRPENVMRLAPDFWIYFGGVISGFPKNVWIGTTVENQEMADKRIPELLKIPAAVRFLSVEPMLGPIDLLMSVNGYDRHGYRKPFHKALHDLHWVIVGGESGPNSRTTQIEWLDGLIWQCRMAQIPVFVKQLGAAFSDPENGIAGRSLKVPSEAAPLISRRLVDRKGGDMSEWPMGLHHRQFPEAA